MCMYERDVRKQSVMATLDTSGTHADADRGRGNFEAEVTAMVRRLIFCSTLLAVALAAVPIAATAAGAGIATLHIQGCVDPGITTYTGTFTISTSGGSVSGSASGPINFFVSPTFDLTLAVTSGTGTFAGTTGTLHAAIDWPGAPAET